MQKEVSMDTLVQKLTEEKKSSLEDCVECNQGIAVTTEGLCEVCDTRKRVVEPVSH